MTKKILSVISVVMLFTLVLTACAPAATAIPAATEPPAETD